MTLHELLATARRLPPNHTVTYTAGVTTPDKDGHCTFWETMRVNNCGGAFPLAEILPDCTIAGSKRRIKSLGEVGHGAEK